MLSIHTPPSIKLVTESLPDTSRPLQISAFTQWSKLPLPATTTRPCIEQFHDVSQLLNIALINLSCTLSSIISVDTSSYLHSTFTHPLKVAPETPRSVLSQMREEMHAIQQASRNIQETSLTCSSTGHEMIWGSPAADGPQPQEEDGLGSVSCEFTPINARPGSDAAARMAWWIGSQGVGIEGVAGPYSRLAEEPSARSILHRTSPCPPASTI